MSFGNALHSSNEAQPTSSPLDDKVKLRLHYRGKFVQLTSGTYKYEEGETFMETVSRSCTYSELVHKFNEKHDSDLSIKYLAPGDELDPANLVSVVDDNDLKEMYDEYFAAQKSAAAQGGSAPFRVRLFLFDAMEDHDMVLDDYAAEYEEDTSYMQQFEKPHGLAAALLEGRSSYGSSLSSSSNPVATHVSDPDATGHSQGLMPVQRMYALPGPYYVQSRAAASVLPQPRMPGAATDAIRPWTEQELLERVAASFSRQAKDVFMAPIPSGSAHSSQPHVQVADAGAADRMGSGAAAAKQDQQPPQQLDQQQANPFAGHAQHDNGWAMVTDSLNVAGAPGTSPHLPSYISVFGDSAQRLPSHISAFGDDCSNGLEMDLEDEVFREMHEDANGGLEETEDGGFRMKTQEFIADDMPAASTQPPTPEQLAVRPPQLAAAVAAAAGGGDAVQSLDLDAAEGRGPGGLQLEMSAVHHVTIRDVQRKLPVGDGAFGEVCRAIIPIFGEVAVKWLKAGKFQKHLDNFRKEAAMLAGLNHPNVLRFYGIVTESHEIRDVVGIITEYMRSGSLAQYLRGRVSKEGHHHYLTLRERCQLALHAARGMTYLHEVKVVHFDLKPDNLLLDGEGSSIVVKVADFGLSKHKIKAYVSTCKDLRGTLPYMAPELVSDPERVSEKADVWSMGVVMWEMLTLEVPYRKQAPQQILMGLMTGSVHLEVPEWCEPEWRGLLEACLDTNPARRPSFKDLATQLERICDLAI